MPNCVLCQACSVVRQQHLSARRYRRRFSTLATTKCDRTGEIQLTNGLRALLERRPLYAYEVDGVELSTGPDGLPIPTGADGAPDGLEILATAPARLWSQHEQPSRYSHEPGELENTAEAVFGPGWRDQVHRLTNNHACIGVFPKPGGGTVFNAGVTDWTCGLRDPDVARVTRTVLDRLSS